jgi:hypothetical protein
VVPGPIQAQRRQGIDVGVGGLDARRRRIDHFEGSDLSAPEQLHGFACTQLGQLVHVSRSSVTLSPDDPGLSATNPIHELSEKGLTELERLAGG